MTADDDDCCPSPRFQTRTDKVLLPNGLAGADSQLQSDIIENYLCECRFLPEDIAAEFVEFVCNKHYAYSGEILMDEIRKAMKIHMHLAKQITATQETRTKKKRQATINRLV